MSVSNPVLDVADRLLTVEPAAALPRSAQNRKTLVAGAVVFLILLIGFWPAFEKEASQMDEGTLLVYPEMLQHGALPYRDFETFYGPANPAVLAAVFSIFGTNIFVERAAGLIYRLLILLAVFAIAQHWSRTIAAGCVFLTGCLLLGTDLPAFAWFGAMACALWSLWMGWRSKSHARCFFAGILAGGALLFRVDVGPAIVISALPLLLAMRWPARRKYLLGGGIALLPLALLTLFTGWRPVVENLFLMPVIYSNPGRHLPLFSAQPDVLHLFFAHLAAVGLNLAAGVKALRSQPRAEGARLLFSVALFGLCLTPQAAQRLDLIHLVFAGFISLGILPLSLVILSARSRHRALVPTGGQTLLATVVVIAAWQLLAPTVTALVRTAFLGALRTDTRTTFLERNGRSFPLHSPEGADITAAMLTKLGTLSAPGDRLFVGPADLRRTNYNDTYLYHLMPELTPATYFLEMNPLSANRPGSRLAADVQSADWLVLNRMYNIWNEPNRSLDYASDLPNDLINREFHLCGEFGPYLLFRRQNRGQPIP